MRNNKTSQPAEVYDSKVELTMPFYRIFHEQSIDLVKTVHPNAESWLDAGGGTGFLIEQASKVFPSTRFMLSDPSDAMLNVAKEKFAGRGDINIEYVLGGTEELDLTKENFDVITAIISHHYLDVETRRTATENCFQMLKKGGIYITFESIRPNTEKGCQIGLNRWRSEQIKNGKTEEESSRHLSRYGIEFFPIKIEEHLKMMRDAGFSTVELFWASIMQVGFYGIR